MACDPPSNFSIGLSMPNPGNPLRVIVCFQLHLGAYCCFMLTTLTTAVLLSIQQEIVNAHSGLTYDYHWQQGYGI